MPLYLLFSLNGIAKRRSNYGTDEIRVHFPVDVPYIALDLNLIRIQLHLTVIELNEYYLSVGL